jgi:hypothetical protein
MPKKLIYKSEESNIMEIKIPLPCPDCGGKMKSVSYDSKFNILKNRSWHICNECSYEQDTEKFKRNLFTI